MNLTGMVKYVSKFDSGGSIFVGLKIDHPGKEATMSRMAPRLSLLPWRTRLGEMAATNRLILLRMLKLSTFLFLEADSS